MDRHCLYCGDILRGRSDQKFCSDQCRNAYNNQINQESNKFMRNVQNILRRNRRILSELNPEGQTTVHRDQLIAKGYNFEFHTNSQSSADGKEYYYCFEHGYLVLENNYYHLVRREEPYS